MFMGLKMLLRLRLRLSRATSPELSASEVEMDIEKLKIHKAPGIAQIPTEMIKTGGRTILSEIHKLINSIWDMKELPRYCQESMTMHIYKGDKPIPVTEAHHS
jgi:hypothetical protein